jgi:thymidylate kinase
MAGELKAETLDAQPATKGLIFLRLAARLQASNIPYCLVGDTQDFPMEIRSDVDFVVTPEALPLIPQLLAGFCADQNIRLVQRLQHEPTAHYFTLAWFGPDGKVCFLNPDFCSHFYHLGRFFLGADELLTGRRVAMDQSGKEKGFYVAAPATDFLYYLIKKMDKGDLSLRSGSWLSTRWRQDPKAARQKIQPFWKEAELGMLVEAAENDRWQPVIEKLRSFRKSLRARRRYSPKALIVESARRLQRVFQPTGLLVAVIGPDGSGKSSVINQTLVSLAPAFRRSKFFHLRPRLGMKPAPPGTTVTDPHGKPPYGWVVSLLKLVYLWCDYTFGYLSVIYPRLARSTLVIFDRYYHDLLVDPRRYRFGGSLAAAARVGKLIPQPDLWILLDAPAELLHQRKREVPLEETMRQCKAYQQLARELPRAVVVDASPGLDQVISAVERAILEVLAERTSKRLGLKRPVAAKPPRQPMANLF